jgi:hypothetical protein
MGIKTDWNIVSRFPCHIVCTVIYSIASLFVRDLRLGKEIGLAGEAVRVTLVDQRAVQSRDDAEPPADVAAGPKPFDRNPFRKLLPPSFDIFLRRFVTLRYQRQRRFSVWAERHVKLIFYSTNLQVIERAA